MKRTLKRELKVLEIVEREAIETSHCMSLLKSQLCLTVHAQCTLHVAGQHQFDCGQKLEEGGCFGSVIASVIYVGWTEERSASWASLLASLNSLQTVADCSAS